MKLINDDCLKAMAEMDGGCIDLTVTSPPYDNLRTYKDSLEWGEHTWKPILEQLYRVTKQGGVVVWVVGDATIKGSESGVSFKQALYAKECGFNLHDTMIYVKNNPMPYKHNRYLPSHEYMFVFSKGKPATFNPILVPTVNAGGKLTTTQREPNGDKRNGSGYGKKRNKLRYRFNVWNYNVGKNQTTKDSIAFDHPAIFPEALANDHIISWSNEGDTVFDPFMGSGTTGKMAKINSRDFIGIEKVEEYFKIAQDRISAT